jgi:hypothetical protein
MIVRDHLSNIVHIDRAKYHSDAEFYIELVRIRFNIVLRPSANGIQEIKSFLKD